MPVIVNLEGSEEDFAKLLILHQIITTEQLTKALENRQTTSAKGGAVESLRDTLLRLKFVSSALIFEVLRVASKVVEECAKCGAIHHIYFYHPHARFFCAYCKGPLKLTDPGQAMKWTPGQLASAAQKASAAGGPPPTATQIIRRANPLDDPSVLMPASAAEDTIFDAGTKLRTKPADPLLKPAATAPKPAPKPAALPPQVPKAPFDPTVTVLPVYGDETMLDMGSTPKSKTMKPATPAAPAAAAPPPPPPPPKPAPAPMDQSIVPSAMGDETMLDMGLSPKPKAAAPATPATPDPVPPNLQDKSDIILNDVMDTMLDMGSRPTGRPVALPGEKPAFPVVPKAGASDFTTSVIPGKTPAGSGSTTIDATKQGGAKLEITQTGPAVDPTMMMTPPSSSSRHESSGSISNVDKTQMQTTPKTGSGMGSAALSNAKAMPEEARAAAKDPNRVFGKYVLLNELGRGGAGVVYKAWDTLLLQYVALKFIRNQDDSDADSTSGSSQIEEFQREARMSVRLRHPNIVRIYEMGCMSNRYYLSMEYIEGGTLLAMIHGGKDRNQKTRFNSNPEHFLKIMINISLAVDYAHHEKQSVIHRDLKPHNVLVDKNGNPYVVDFGLAKEVDSGDGATLTGVVKGTPTYMAPEQAEGRNRDVDLRTDCYALGAILYEMLTGRPPFLGESVPEILRKIATELPERPNDVITKAAIAEGATANSKTKTKPFMIPKALETICLKALEKNKTDRYQTAKEFAEDIDRYMKGEDILASEPNLWRRFRRTVRAHPIISAAAAAIILAAGTGIIAVKSASGGEDAKIAIARKVKDGDDALKAREWAKLGIISNDIANFDKSHPKVTEYQAAIKAHEKEVREHDEMLAKTSKEWNVEVERLRLEPLSKVLPALREKYNRYDELKPKFQTDLKDEATRLQTRLLGESRGIIGTGDRKPWVNEFVKTKAQEAKEQAETLKSLITDKDFVYPKEQEDALKEVLEKLDRVIAYQGTWNLQVNVAPFAEVTILQADQELATDSTPVGIKEMEVVGSSYIVEICWPSRKDAKVTVKQEIKDLHNNQTVVIRGDLSKGTVKQERKEPK